MSPSSWVLLLFPPAPGATGDTSSRCDTKCKFQVLIEQMCRHKDDYNKHNNSNCHFTTASILSRTTNRQKKNTGKNGCQTNKDVWVWEPLKINGPKSRTSFLTPDWLRVNVKGNRYLHYFSHSCLSRNCLLNSPIIQLMQ